MNQLLENHKRLLGIGVLVICALFVFTPAVEAQEFVYGDVVPAGETVENDVLLNGDAIQVDGDVDGDVFAFGRSIKINGTITGSLITVGEEVIINGTVEGSVYAIALSLQLGEGSTIGHSIYFVGGNLVTDRDSFITRDLNAITLSARLQGSVGRETDALIGIIEIARLIVDGFNTLNSGKETTSTGVLQEQSTAVLKVVPAQVARVGEKQLMFATLQTETEETQGDEVSDWVTRYFQALVSFLIVGGLAIWLIPTRFEQWGSQLRAKPLHAFGWGIVAYIVGFVAAILLLLLIIAVAVSLGFVSLTGLALTWLGLGLSGLGVAFWTFILFLAFMSKAIVAFVLGLLILERVYPRGTNRHLWPLLVGLMIYVLLCMIPVLGWVVGFIVTCLGLGAVWLVLRNKSQDGVQETAVA